MQFQTQYLLLTLPIIGISTWLRQQQKKEKPGLSWDI